MWNVNKGYVGRSMSVRAAEAYGNGEKPLSKWTKAKIMDSILDIVYDYDLDLDLEEIAKLTVEEMKDNLLTLSSWHHTGKHYNVTYFYSVDVDGLKSLNVDEIIASREPRKPREKKVEIKPEKLKCRWVEDGCEVRDYGVRKGNWFYPDNHFGKKKVNGKYFEILCNESEFGIKYKSKMFEKGTSVEVEIEGENYNRTVRKCKKGLYVVIANEKVFDEDCILK